MRIISGSKKGKKILLPDPKITRPLKDNVKENIFNILLHSDKLKINFKDIKVIDFFSGSGSFGLECISRGALSIKFIENSPQIVNTLFRNLSNNFDKNKFEIIKKDFFSIDKLSMIKSFNPNIIFLDPPYEIDKFEYILDFISMLKSFNNLTIILHVHKKKEVHLKVFKYYVERVYGLSKIIFFKN